MRRLFIADLHLADVAEPAFRTLAAVLDGARGTVDELYLLGDLCEVWVGDDDDGPFAHALTALLRTAAHHMRVRLMAGNRDFLFGARFGAATGVELIPDPCPLPAGILLAHGDAFCTDDTAYQAARAVLRAPAWQQDVLARSLAERRALARQMRAESRAGNANKPENIMDVNAAEVARVVAAAGARILVHGHTHRPGIHREPWGVRYVLGAWERCAWLLYEDAGTFTLSCRPFVTSAATGPL